MSRFNIGIDTGGTYTDAVIVDLESRQVLASAKSETTHGDLAIGVSAALGKVLEDAGEQFNRDEVALVSVSTTLATNALVEGQGSPVAAILIGFDDAMATRTRIAEAVPDAQVIRIDGGHDHTGEESVSMNDADVLAAIDQIKDKVAAWSVSSMYSVRNAAHEHRAEELIREKTGMSVTISSDLSDELDGPRRALTATMNARIISKIVSLIDAVKSSLANESIDARLMVVKGDGSLASAELVAERPIETILSGPAASVIGARYLSQLDDFVVSDIGGTTTDIAVAHNRWPDTNERGSMVGDFRTLVKAIDMQTTGLGGDSEVRVEYDASIELSNSRAVPLALLGARWPSVEKHLAAVLRAGKGYRTACRFLLRPEGAGTGNLLDASEREKALLEQVGEEPQPWSAVVHRVADEKVVMGLISKGALQLGAFTPSDAAHVLGRQEQWSISTAKLGCQVLGRSCNSISKNEKLLDEEMRAFASRITDAVAQKTCHVLIEKLGGQRFDPANPLVAAITSGNGSHNNLGITLSPQVPLVAVGGPAGIYYPEVGRRLNAETVIPEHAAVANAVGAAVGLIKVTKVVEVAAHEDGRFLVHLDDQPKVMSSATKALATARKHATDAAEKQAVSMGAQSTEVEVDVARIDVPDTSDDLGLIAATITAECVGRL